MHALASGKVVFLDYNTEEKCYFCNKKAHRIIIIKHKSLPLCNDCDDDLPDIYW